MTYANNIGLSPVYKMNQSNSFSFHAEHISFFFFLGGGGGPILGIFFFAPTQPAGE